MQVKLVCFYYQNCNFKWKSKKKILFFLVFSLKLFIGQSGVKTSFKTSQELKLKTKKSFALQNFVIITYYYYIG